MWYKKMDPHSFEEELVSIYRCDAILAGYENGHLRKPINHHKYEIIVFLGGQKTRHVIHQYGFQRPIKSRKRAVQALLLDGWLGNGICSARFDILVDILSKFWPKKMFL
jgi:hypothetical protein